MFDNIIKYFKKLTKTESKETKSKDSAKERLHLVLMQDRANISADFLDLMKQEIIEVIKKYIDVDEKEIDVRLTNKTNDDGTNGAPVLYANIPIVSIKEDVKKKEEKPEQKEQNNVNNNVQQTDAKKEENNTNTTRNDTQEQKEQQDNKTSEEVKEEKKEEPIAEEKEEETTKQIDEACEIIEEISQEEKEEVEEDNSQNDTVQEKQPEENKSVEVNNS